jgi:hypothetical protein
VLDAARAYGHYLERATAASHVHPWHYYLGLLAHFPASGTPFWTEAAILVLAAVGAASAWLAQVAPGADRSLLRFVAVYTGLMVVGLLGDPVQDALVPARLPARDDPARGSGRRVARGPRARLLAGACRGGRGCRVGPSAVAGVGRELPLRADPRNPYVYAHTSTDVLEMVARLTQLAESHPAGRAMPLQVVTRRNAWPLPWYLRRLTGVEWWTGVSDAARLAPVVVVTPDQQRDLVRRIYEVPPPGERELYVSVFDREMELRPGVELRAYASAALWEALQAPRGRGARGCGRTVSAVHRFSHDAMNTTFEVRACHEDEGYAGQAAHAAFALLDRLEQELSRFVPNSDVSRINDLEPGGSTRVSASTLECLSIARQLYELTGAPSTCRSARGSKRSSSRRTSTECALTRRRPPRPRRHRQGLRRRPDGRVLEEWGIERALVHGGRSSVVALEPPPGEDGWTLTLRAAGAQAPVLERLRARQRALSASGTRKREHILDPRTGQPVARGAVWVVLPRGLEGGRSPAAVAEGLSTAFMVLPEDGRRRALPLEPRARAVPRPRLLTGRIARRSTCGRKTGQ